jgi:hypothetical protein
VLQSIAGPTDIEHASLPPNEEAAAAESLQMALMASGLAIADVWPFSVLTRLRACAWVSTFEVQTMGRLHRHYALM